MFYRAHENLSPKLLRTSFRQAKVCQSQFRLSPVQPVSVSADCLRSEADMRTTNATKHNLRNVVSNASRVRRTSVGEQAKQDCQRGVM